MSSPRKELLVVAVTLIIIGAITVSIVLAAPARQDPDAVDNESGKFEVITLAPPAPASPPQTPIGPRNNLNQAGGNGAEGIQDTPMHLMNYQGRLLQNGSPYNGNINITFRLYKQETGGTEFWSETQNVSVSDGLFNVTLGTVNPMADAQEFQGQVWLGIQPAGAASELSPRQPLGAVAYAMNLLPGATMVDPGLSGYWTSFYVSSQDHPAIYGFSSTDVAVTGETIYTGTNAVEGYSYGTGSMGVYGQSNGFDGSGLYGYLTADADSCSGDDTYCAAGVYGTASGDAYGSFFFGDTRSAIIASQDDDNSFYTFWAQTQAYPNGYGIWTDGESRFQDYVTFSGGKSGYVVDIARNGGDEVLERGDVVVISGYDTPVVGNIPVIVVTKATEANATGVVGVVDVLYVPCDRPQEELQAGEACGGFQQEITSIQPGQYLSVVTLGAYAYLKADASNGPIQPGDLLAASTTAGYAAAAPLLTVEGVSFHAPGTIIGKALGGLEEGTGFIPVFVSSR